MSTKADDTWTPATYVYWIGVVPLSLFAVQGAIIIIMDWSTERYKFSRLIWMTLAVSIICFSVLSHVYDKVKHMKGDAEKFTSIVTFTIRSYMTYLYAYLAAMQYMWMPHTYNIIRQDLTFFHPTRVGLGLLVIFLWALFVRMLKLYLQANAAQKYQDLISQLFHILQLVLPQVLAMFWVVGILYQICVKPPKFVSCEMSHAHTVIARIDRSFVNNPGGKSPKRGQVAPSTMKSDSNKHTIEEVEEPEEEPPVAPFVAMPDSKVADHKDMRRRLSTDSDLVLKLSAFPDRTDDVASVPSETELQKTLINNFQLETDMGKAVALICIPPLFIYTIGFSLRPYIQKKDHDLFWAALDAMQFLAASWHIVVLLITMPAFRHSIRRKFRYTIKYRKCPPSIKKIWRAHHFTRTGTVDTTDDNTSVHHIFHHHSQIKSSQVTV